MEWHTVTQLGPHHHETREGYLVYTDVVIARTGTQVYFEHEIPPLIGDSGGRVHVEREPEDVFNPDSIKSYNGKPITDDHPDFLVGPDNWSDLSLGFISNVRRGTRPNDDVLVGDMLFTTRRGIKAVKGGKRAISIGYTANYDQSAPGIGRQTNIFCNHTALVDEGRCGSRCVILDGKPIWSRDDFSEADHPRVPAGNPGGGEFTSGGGGGGASGGGDLTSKMAMTFAKSKPLPQHELNGVAFEKWHAPEHKEGWETQAAKGASFKEPKFDPKPGKTTGAGVIIQEPDGRVWIVHPTNQFGGYKATFPKGTVEDGMTQRATALKEAFEESGLKVELTGFAGDVERGTSKARYYFAKRVGGSPADHHWESEGVTLAPPEDLKTYLNHPTDHEMVDKFLSQPGETSIAPIEKTPVAEQPNEGGTAPPSIAGWSKIGGKLGSNNAAQMEDETGAKHYVKFQKSNDHARNEVLASRLYEEAGAPALQPKLVDTGNGALGTATRWKEGVKLIDPSKASDRHLAQENFATHAWLANWDAPGLSYDNQGWINDEMHTLDVGGSLLYRAQGDPKGAAFGDSASEWDTLRDPKNAQAHKLFGSMTDEQLKASAQRVADVSDETIKALVDEHGPGLASVKADLTAKLIARRDDIAKRAGLSEKPDEFDPADLKLTEPVKSGSELAAAVPMPPGWLGNSGKKVQAAVQEGLKTGEDPEALAGKIKAAALMHSHPNSATYANNMLKLVEAHHGLKTGSLGKAVPKPKTASATPAGTVISPPSSPVKVVVAPPVKAPPAPTPAPSGLPPPAPGNPAQETLHKAIESSPTYHAKVAALNALAGGWANPETAAYHSKLKAAVEAQHEAAAKMPVPDNPNNPAQNSLHMKVTNATTHAEKMTAINAVLAGGMSMGTQEYAKKLQKAVNAQHEAAAGELENFKLNPEPAAAGTTLPAPHETFTAQKLLHQAVSNAKTHAEKMAAINATMSAQTSEATKEYAGKVKAAVEAQAVKTLPKPGPGGDGLHKIASDPQLTTEAKIAQLNAADIHHPKIEEYKNKLVTALGGTPSPTPTLPFSIDPVSGPEPNQSSNKQKEIHAIAKSDATHHAKTKKIAAIGKEANPGGTTEAFANAYLTAMGAPPVQSGPTATPTTPAKPAPAATTVTKNPHGLTKFPHHYHEAKHRLEDSTGKKVTAVLHVDSERIPGDLYQKVSAAYGDKSNDGNTIEVGKAMQEAGNGARDRLSEPEISAVQSYKGAGYTSINKALLGEDSPSSGVQGRINRLRAVMKREVIPASTPAFRGLRATLKQLSGFDDPELAVGRAFVHKNFASMSRNIVTAESFGAMHHEGSPTTMMHVMIPAGAPGLVLSGSHGSDQVSGEKEIVMPDHSVFRIDKVEATGSKGIKHHIHVTYMGAYEDNG